MQEQLVDTVLDDAERSERMLILRFFKFQDYKVILTEDAEIQSVKWKQQFSEATLPGWFLMAANMSGVQLFSSSQSD